VSSEKNYKEVHTYEINFVRTNLNSCVRIYKIRTYETNFVRTKLISYVRIF